MISVLYVDDEEALLEITKLFMEQDGEITVDTATSAMEGLIMAGNVRYDVIVSDYQMPGMNGIDFLKKLRSDGNDVPFIIFTGKGREEIVIEALNSGADFYLQKGGEPRSQFAELRSKVRQASSRRQAEHQVMYLNRIYALLSKVNESIIRVHTQDELFRAICETAITLGEFRMAWIGLVDEAAGILRPVASAGNGATDYLTVAGIALKDGPRAQGPSSRAVQEGRQVIVNDTLNDPVMEPWRDLVTRFGYRASAAFPFRCGGQVTGTLNLYAAEPQFFSEKEVQLLAEVAEDISFSLDMLERETARLAALDALRASEEQYHTLFETMVQGVVYQDALGRITRSNPAAERILGLTHDQMIGRTSLDPRWRAVREDGRDFPGEEHFAMVALASGRPERGIMGVFNPVDDQYRWILVTAVPQFRDGETRPFQVFSTFEDITLRKINEETLRRNEEKFRIIFDTAPILILSINLRGAIVDCNQRVEDILGYSKKEIIGRPVTSLADPSHQERLSAFISTVPYKEEYPFQVTMLRRDGTPVATRINSTQLRNKKGAYFRTVLFIEDYGHCPR